MNNQVAISVVKAIASAKCNTIITTIVTNNGSVYENIKVDTFDVECVLFDKTCYVSYNSIVGINVINVPE